MNYKLLFIDDDEDIISAWKMFLEEVPEVEPHFAISGTDARTFLEKTRYDVIISDVSMPDGEGVSVINYVLKQDVERPIFLFLTGSTHIDADYLKAMGADGVFYKPAEIDEVLNYIQDELSRKNHE